ncbi:hypothetical protein BsWGS_24093 [Bradybaena similaris]
MRSPLLHLLVLTYFLTCVSADGENQNEAEASEFLQLYNQEMAEALNKLSMIAWQAQINLEEPVREEMVNMSIRFASWKKSMRDRAVIFNASAMSPDIQRQLAKVKDIGVAAQPEEKYSKLAKVLERMHSLYNRPEQNLLAPSNGSEDSGIRQARASVEGHNNVVLSGGTSPHRYGSKMRKLFTKYVKLSNEAVKFAGYSDLGEQWRSMYEITNLEKEVQRLNKEVRPLYVQLHAYVRKKLSEVHRESNFPSSRHIPESILGGVQTEDWNTIFHLVEPFKRHNVFNYRFELKRQNYTVLKMFQAAEDFIVSLGFEKMVPTFWEKSVFERPYGRHMECTASAWDFFDGRDFRAKMCGEVKERVFSSAHHEMGHLAYYMAYRDQPTIYKDGANDAFHDAISSMFTLSFETPEHLKKLNLIDHIPYAHEEDINILMNTALKTVAYIPYAYLVDAWRWAVFDGNITSDRYMREWYRLRCKLTGISPLQRSSEKHFIPGAIRNVGKNKPYIKYFFSFFLQFQFLKAACAAANHTGPLHRCDIYNSTEAGNQLRKMMALGSSKPWPEALQQLTGQSRIDSKPLLEYFRPLHKFLRRKNKKARAWRRKCR